VYKLLILSLLIIFQTKTVVSQNYPQDYFTAPLNIKPLLSGTFAEIRGNHFHSGIDIKTQGIIGHEVYATADGYVSRIKIAANAYGKAIYLTHPNGYSTVYAHLDRFSPLIDSILKKEQYKKASFEIDFYPTKNFIKVSRGQIIGYSGNSGSSGGPHLHYEIRDKHERPLNPLLFGLKIEDNINPEINAIRLYSIFEKEYPLKITDFKQVKNSLNLSRKDTVQLSNRFYIGINTIDKQNESENLNGIFNIIIKKDSVEIFKVVADRIDFAEQRYINSYIDYKALYNWNVALLTTKRQPGSKLTIYERIENEGIIDISDSMTHLISISISDFSNNTSKIEFFVKNGLEKPLEKINETNNFFHDKDNYFELSDAKIHIPEGSLYEDMFFMMTEEFSNSYSLSKLIKVGNPQIPLHKYSTLSIKPIKQYIEFDFSKLAVASFSRNGNIVYEGGEFANGWVTTKTRSFGTYFIVIDTIKPIITPLNVKDYDTLLNQKYLIFTINDELSGINKYSGFVNEKWVLGDYDEKTKTIKFEIDDYWSFGDVKFLFVIEDKKKNKADLKLNLYRKQTQQP
jgi:hypothetical protein